MLATVRLPNAARSVRLGAAALTFVIWALLAASVLWWWLRAGGSAAPEAPVAGRASADVDSAAVARVLGAAGAAEAPTSAPAASSDGQFALRGVLTHGEGGAALVAVSGKVRAVRVGAPVGKDAEGWTLHEAQPHAVVLASSGGRQVRLEMPGVQERQRFLERGTKHRTAPTSASGPAAKSAPRPAPTPAPAAPAPEPAPAPEEPAPAPEEPEAAPEPAPPAE